MKSEQKYVRKRISAGKCGNKRHIKSTGGKPVKTKTKIRGMTPDFLVFVVSESNSLLRDSVSVKSRFLL